ncbi:CPBP family glutamic-type intramembrane protease [Brevibacillus borstelensis]|uniref:CPBP family glutamic-type intramembrane protease n=1 Tax=Brevibacillus borstelensis TaxID=45462 RepID=UPI0030BF9E61
MDEIGMGMRLLLLLCGPSAMILIGLQGMGSVPLTFALFYSWLLLVPLGDMLTGRGKKISEAMKDCGLVFKRKNMYDGICTGILFFLAIVLAGYFFHSHVFEKEKLPSLLMAWNFSGDHLIWLILILLSVNPFLEELYWRGYIYTRLSIVP